MSDPRYARRRRAAVPAALAAFTMLLVASGAGVPLSWAGGSPFTPAMTIVLPAQQVALAPDDASPPDEPATPDDSAASPAPAPAPAPSGGSAHDPAPSGDGGDGSDTGEEPQPAVRHVFVVMLSETDLVALAGDDATTFATRLVPQGTLLTGYASVARGPLANGIALLSGQGPTQQTLAGCPPPAGAAAGAPPADVTPDVLGDDGQQIDADGCVYPFATGTVADQLTGAGLGWRAYVEDAADASAAAAPCPVAVRDPFAWFHSLLDTGACARHVTGLDALDADLARGRSAPALLYVAPNTCHDGQAAPCAPGAPAGAAAADAFLADLIPRILASPAYADGGLIVITSDGPPPPPAAPAPTTTPTVPTTPTTPTTPTPTSTTSAAPPAAAAAASAPATPVPATYPNVGDAAAAGAARVGALLISAAVPAGRRSDAAANHFTLLRAISDLFALQPLGYAGAAGLRPLPADVLVQNSQ